MIGVISKESEREIIQEFFELFKTPWEFHKKDKSYDIILLTYDPKCVIEARLIIIYNSQEDALCGHNKSESISLTNVPMLHYKDLIFPIYGKISTLHENTKVIARITDTNDIVAVSSHNHHHKMIRVGFDLFQEVEHLLRQGQPSQYALFPTLDMHIAMLRDWIVSSGLPLIEVLSSPAGFDFTVCLTHDIDFLRLRDHKFDRTMFGFLYRASFRSFLDFLQGRLSLVKLLRNWTAVCLLPGVYLGLIKDYFFQFDKYLEVEEGLVSTFFIIPFKHRPGIDKNNQVHRARAAQYDIDDIEPEIKKLILAGREIGLHGIDAWRDPAKGREELQRIAQITGNHSVGIRTHWLYQCVQSPKHMEKAGFIYDSSVGYNETIGYYSGTAQVFRPPSAVTLLELPLHIMDTSLFYAGHMDLAETHAMTLVEKILVNAQRFGGVLTINWHDRSMGTERLWDTAYKSIISRLKMNKVWFATASQAVSWFRARRSVFFHDVNLCNNELKVRLSSSIADNPQLLLRVHLPQELDIPMNDMPAAQGRIIDISFSGNLNISLCL